MILILFLKTCFCVQETAEILIDTACRMPTNLRVMKGVDLNYNMDTIFILLLEFASRSQQLNETYTN